jgi:hypothetical protein
VWWFFSHQRRAAILREAIWSSTAVIRVGELVAGGVGARSAVGLRSRATGVARLENWLITLRNSLS